MNSITRINASPSTLSRASSSRPRHSENKMAAKEEKKYKLTTVVEAYGLNELTAESTNGDNYIIRFAGELRDIDSKVVCAECEEYSRIREEHMVHNRECPDFLKWLKQYPVERDKNPNTCETCNKTPESDPNECCHSVHPDFLKIKITTHYADFGQYQVVNFYTNTASVDELLPLMEKADEWVKRQRYPHKRED